MMEREETKKLAGGMAELPDEELDQVSGGYDTYDKFIGKKFYPGLWGGNTVEKNVCKRYKWEGGDINLKYRCPNCGRLVHKSHYQRNRLPGPERGAVRNVPRSLRGRFVLGECIPFESASGMTNQSGNGMGGNHGNEPDLSAQRAGPIQHSGFWNAD